MRVLRTASCAAAVGLLLGAVPAAASCVGPVPMEESLRAADSVFVGSVVGLANADRTATFAVDQVWRPRADVGPPGAVLIALAAFVVLGVVGALAFRRGSLR